MPLSHSTQFGALTAGQERAIGAIIVEWSNVEFLVENALARLSQTPDFLALALTNDLNISHRITSLKNLIRINRERYYPSRIPDEMEIRFRDVIGEINELKDKRNKMVHYCWCRHDDQKIFGIRFRGKLPDKVDQNANIWIVSLGELEELRARMYALVQELAALVQELPEVPESGKLDA